MKPVSLAFACMALISPMAKSGNRTRKITSFGSDVMLALSTSQELRDHLRENGMLTVRENYSWETITRKIVELYRQVITKQR
jgi:glycosyltransferase involved in cell wall biosynthesis